MHDRDVIDMLIEILIAGRGGGAVDINQPPFTHPEHDGPRPRARARRRHSSSTTKGMVRKTARRAYKPKRKVSAYQREFGRQLKKLKKKHPRTPVTRLMKRAHAATKRARRGK